MTGTARGPERGSPEYRTADYRDSKTPRQAMKSLHAAERQLVAAQRGDAIARALAELAVQAELTSASRRRSLSAHYAAKVAALAPSLTKDERHAAIARLRDEESAAMQALDLELKQDAAAERSRTVTHLKQHYKAQSTGLSQRQLRQRATLALLFRRPARRRTSPSPRQDVRAVATRILQRRAGHSPPRTPR